MRKLIAKLREGYLKEFLDETRWMYRYTRRYWKGILFYIFSGLFGTVMSLGSSVASKYLIDAVCDVQTDRIAIIAIVMVCMAAGSIAANAIISRISTRIGVVVQNEIQADIYNKVIFTDWESLNAFRSGDILNRLTSDASQVASSVIGWVPTLITKLAQFIGTFAVIFYYDPIMALIALLSAPVMVLLSRKMMVRMSKYNKEMRGLTSDLMTFQNDSFQNISTIKAFDLMDSFRSRLSVIQTQYKDKMMDYNLFSVGVSSLMSALGSVVSYLCLGWSVYRLWTGYITTGTLLMFLQMANSLTSAFSSLVQVVPSAINATTCAGRLMAVSELDKEKVLDEEQVRKLKKRKSDGISVELRQVQVHYRDGEPVVENGCFAAKKGEIVTLIGPSGEGKTTLIRTFLGMMYPSQGEALLVGADGTECRISSATRRFFGYVPQGNTMFAGTIEENMRLVKSDATDAEIEAALRIGCAWDFVKKLPEGTGTVIGEHGTGLSEGQAQRLAIARAVLTDAPILLFDEATSALDEATEARVLQNILECGKNRTCIVTSHRPGVMSISHHIYEIHGRSLCQRK